MRWYIKSENRRKFFVNMKNKTPNSEAQSSVIHVEGPRQIQHHLVQVQKREREGEQEMIQRGGCLCSLGTKSMLGTRIVSLNPVVLTLTAHTRTTCRTKGKQQMLMPVPLLRDFDLSVLGAWSG